MAPRPLVLLGCLAVPLAAQDPAPPPPPPPPTTMMSAAEADPEAPRGLTVNADGTFDGYTLYAPLNGKTIYLIDLDGTIVHTWETDTAPGAWNYLLDDGTLLRGGRIDEDPKFNGGGIGGLVQKLAPDGTVIWNYRIADENLWQHHDIEPMPNGNVLAIAWERLSADEAIALGRDPKGVGKAGLWPDAILELKPVPPDNAEIVWQWRARDHLIQDFDESKPGFGSIPDNPGRIDINAGHRDTPPMTPEQLREQREMEKQLRALGYAGGNDPDAADKDDDKSPDRSRRDRSGDWLHTNAVAYDPELDLIALSSPELCELWIIDHSTTTAEAASSRGGRHGKGGDLLWRWGNPKHYGFGEDADQQLFYQHDPRWVRGDDGSVRLLVFNNGRGRSGEEGPNFSSVDELILPFDRERGFTREPGQPFGPIEPVWSYSSPDDFFSAFISGCQRLPNGNTLICSGAPGRLFEVTRSRDIVWDYRSPHGGEVTPPEHAGKAPPHALFRGTRLARDHAGVKALR